MIPQGTKPPDKETDINIWTAPFTMENCLRAKEQHRRRLAALPIGQKIRIVEKMQKTAAVFRKGRGEQGK